jgi:hypothetical protein
MYCGHVRLITLWRMTMTFPETRAVEARYARRDAAADGSATASTLTQCAASSRAPARHGSTTWLE